MEFLSYKKYMFKFVRNYQTVFQHGGVMSHSHMQ